MLIEETAILKLHLKREAREYSRNKRPTHIQHTLECRLPAIDYLPPAIINPPISSTLYLKFLAFLSEVTSTLETAGLKFTGASINYEQVIY